MLVRKKKAYRCFLTLVGNPVSQQTPWSSDSYNLSVVNVSIGAMLHVSVFLIVCGSLSVGEKFLGWGLRTTLICGYKSKYANIYDAVRNYASLGTTFFFNWSKASFWDMDLFTSLAKPSDQRPRNLLISVIPVLELKVCHIPVSKKP